MISLKIQYGVFFQFGDLPITVVFIEVALGMSKFYKWLILIMQVVFSCKEGLEACETCRNHKETHYKNSAKKLHSSVCLYKQ